MQFNPGNDGIPGIWECICDGEGENDREKGQKGLYETARQKPEIGEKWSAAGRSLKRTSLPNKPKEDQKPEMEQVSRYKK